MQGPRHHLINLRRNGHLVQSVTGITSVYVVREASQTDDGTYACAATNRVDSTDLVLKTVTIFEGVLIFVPAFTRLRYSV